MKKQIKKHSARSAIRATADHVATGLAILASILVVVPLIAIFVYLVYKGASSLNLAFFTQIPKPEGEVGGGMANAIAGSALLLGIASVLGIPVGIGGGIYLAEFGRGTRLANAIRFTADVLNGVPSIVMGIAAYSLVVVPQHHFSAFSGGVALGIMMVPTIIRTTAKAQFISKRVRRSTNTTPSSANSDPTERSIPPVMMTNPAPIE